MVVPSDSVVVIYSRNGERYALRLQHNPRLTVLDCMKQVHLYSPRRTCHVNGMRAPHRSAVAGGSVVVLGQAHHRRI
jgi:hypothetical protein